MFYAGIEKTVRFVLNFEVSFIYVIPYFREYCKTGGTGSKFSSPGRPG